MADVDIQCLSCGNQITVSDVVDIAKLKCRACGGEFLRSGAARVALKKDSGDKKRALMGKSASAAAPAVNVSSAAAASQEAAAPEAEANRIAWEKLNNPEAQAAVQRQSKKMYSALTWKAWIVFIITGAVAGGIRYSGLVPQGILESAVVYEAVTLLAFYVIIVLKAFQDSVFQGILCFLLPPYSIYYLFSASDDFYLRAVISGLLIGIGQDAGIVIHEWSGNVINAVNDWIASGG